jgi:membrane associated rhomboid family serine protease
MATCYRHPDRETGVSCSSCERPICPDCMTPTPVGMRCPECARQRTKVRTAQTLRRAGDALPVTRALIAVNVLAYIGEIAAGGGGLNGFSVHNSLVQHLALWAPGVADGEWWRLITGGFLHGGLLHIGFNMYLLWILGRMIEPAIGSVRFGGVYLVSLLAGSLGALLVSPHEITVGASGAVFGLMGFAFFELRARGIDPFQAGIGWLIVLNLGLSFVLSNISVGGHIGGLVGGSLAALALQLSARRRNEPLGLAVCALLAIVAAVAGIAASNQIV